MFSYISHKAEVVEIYVERVAHDKGDREDGCGDGQIVGVCPLSIELPAATSTLFCNFFLYQRNFC